MTDKHETVYILINKNNGAKIECTEKFLLPWMARGFEILEIVLKGKKDNKANWNR